MAKITISSPHSERKVVPPKGKGKEKEKMVETEIGEEIGTALLEEM